MSLDGIVQGVAALLTSSQQTWATQSFWDCAQHAHWRLENARPSESRLPALLGGPAARTPPSAFPFLQITMSKSHREDRRDAASRTPNGSKSPTGSQRQPHRRPGMARFNSAPVRRIARSRI